MPPKLPFSLSAAPDPSEMGISACGNGVAGACQGAGSKYLFNPVSGLSQQGNTVLLSKLNRTMFIDMPHCANEHLHTLWWLPAGNSSGNGNNPA